MLVAISINFFMKISYIFVKSLFKDIFYKMFFFAKFCEKKSISIFVKEIFIDICRKQIFVMKIESYIWIKYIFVYSVIIQDITI